MKNITSLLLLLLGSYSIVLGQGKKTAGDAFFQKGLAFYNQQAYENALKVFDEIVKDKNKVSEHVYAKALSYIPKIYMETGQTAVAKKGFNTVIASNIKDNDTSGGDELNPYGNYKHDASLYLAQLYYNDSDFAAALNWLYKADTLYPYYASPENPTAAVKSAAGILNWEVMMLQKLNRPEDAIQRIVYELICAQQFTGYFHDEETMLVQMIANNKNDFVSEFNAALAQIKMKNIDTHNQVATFIFRKKPYHFHLTNEDQHTPYIIYRRLFVMPAEKKMSSVVFVDLIRRSLFYRQLIN